MSIFIFNKFYESYDEATRDLLNVGKNTLYRYAKRNNISGTIVELIAYCLENNISEKEIKNPIRHWDNFTKSFEEAAIERFGEKGYSKLFIQAENIIDPKHVGFQSHEKVNIHCWCQQARYLEDVAIFRIFNNKKCLCQAETSKQKNMREEDTLAYKYPIVEKIWSEKNDCLPTEVLHSTNREYWWKCDNGYHEDYRRKLAKQKIILDARETDICPECSKLYVHQFEDLTGRIYHDLYVEEFDREATFRNSMLVSGKTRSPKMWKCRCKCGAQVIKNGALLKGGYIKNCGDKKIHYSGENNGNWQGGITSEHEMVRKSPEYDEWRKKVYKKDNYTCQACGVRKSGANIELHAHHIISFSSLLANSRDILFCENIGITLCEDCHFSNKEDSLHNIYGTSNVKPEELEKFINIKRRQCGINDPFSVVEYMNRDLGNLMEKISYKTVAELCRENGISSGTYRSRIKSGMSTNEALKTPVKSVRMKCTDHLGKEFISKSEMCRYWNVPLDAYIFRMKSGWRLEKALTTPLKKAKEDFCDHLGNKYATMKKMCEQYGIAPETYSQRIKRGWNVQEALLGIHERKKKIKDYNGNLFYTEADMCDYYGISYSTYLKRKAKGLDNKECLKVVRKETGK